jgi:hypothetical protein
MECLDMALEHVVPRPAQVVLLDADRDLDGCCERTAEIRAWPRTFELQLWPEQKTNQQRRRSALPNDRLRH